MENVTHNERFAALQEKYYANNRDSEVLGEMYLVVVEYLTNRIRKYCREKNVRIDIEEKVDIGATWLIERYLKFPDFHIDKLSAYGHFAYLKGLYANKEIEQKEKYSIEQMQEEYGDRWTEYLIYNEDV